MNRCSLVLQEFLHRRRIGLAPENDREALSQGGPARGFSLLTGEISEGGRRKSRVKHEWTFLCSSAAPGNLVVPGCFCTQNVTASKNQSAQRVSRAAHTWRPPPPCTCFSGSFHVRTCERRHRCRVGVMVCQFRDAFVPLGRVGLQATA